MRKWLPPHAIRVSRYRVGDIIVGTFVNIIVSSRFKFLFEQSKLKGIESFHPVAVYLRKDLVDEEYFYPAIEMSNFLVDLTKSGFEFEGSKRCSACQKGGSVIRKWKGIIFERPEEIDLDIFNIKVLGETPIVSQRFYDFAVEHQFSNLAMIDASKYGTTWAQVE
jgi:hypothetical protein